MPSAHREWSVPVPVRALLWWPALSLVLVAVAPDAAIGSIIAAGAGLALFGALAATLTRHLKRRAAPAARAPQAMADAPTMEFPTAVMPRMKDDRAA